MFQRAISILLCWMISVHRVCSQIQRNGRSFDGKFEDVKANKRLVVNVLLTFVTNQAGHCIARCLQHSKCKSININIEQKKCQILDQVWFENPNSGEDANGWIYYGYLPPSAHSNCKTYQIIGAFGPEQTDVCCPRGRAGDKCQYFKGFSEKAPDKSCKVIKENYPSSKSGLYWIQLDTVTQVYCDMETDGGGWIMIGNLTLSTKEQSANYVFDNAGFKAGSYHVHVYDIARLECDDYNAKDHTGNWYYFLK